MANYADFDWEQGLSWWSAAGLVGVHGPVWWALGVWGACWWWQRLFTDRLADPTKPAIGLDELTAIGTPMPILLLSSIAVTIAM